MFRKLQKVGEPALPANITINGVNLEVEEGESIAAILLRTPPYTSRFTPVTGAPRAPFCMMGACFECLVSVDGETSKRSCLEFARDGMAVVRQPKRPDPLAEVLS